MRENNKPVVCSGLTSMLSTEPDLKVCASASSGERALALVEHEQFDVMLLDLRMRGMDRIAVLQKLKTAENPPRVIVLTSFAKEEEIYRAIRAGAQGYLLKDASDAEMAAAISAVAGGKRYIPHDIAARLANRMLRQDLTSRDIEVLALLAEGATNKHIAAALKISDNTVRCHINNIMEKLQVSDRTESVAYAAKKGVLAGTDETGLHRAQWPRS